MASSSSWAQKTGFKPVFSAETKAGQSSSRQPDLEASPVVSTPSPAVNDVPHGDKVPPSPSDGVPTNNARVEERTTRLPVMVDHDDLVLRRRPSPLNYELTDSPALVFLAVYGIQHYLSIIGSLILTPLVIAPAMGASHDETAAMVCTVLLVSGVTTLLHTIFGSRLPLIQGPSFVYLAPVLAIINSPEFQELNENKFKHIMKELQGAIIIGSAFQTLLGYTGLMSLLVRFINPVVVSSTIAAVGLSFYSYGFPLVGTCLEIGAVQILVFIVFCLYLRKISVFGHHIFQIYAVPLGLAVTWTFAFLLTENGRMKHCQVNTSDTMTSPPWFRFPYPLQWGTPVFNWKMAIVMCVVSLISSVDSVGTYHTSSLLAASGPPTPGVLSRGIGLEGFSSLLAGLWGTGMGSTTLTENVHTIAGTKMGSRRPVQLGACLLIVLSLFGKVGGFIASIPEAMVAGLLCIMWAMLTALGLSNLRYTETGSSRNIIIVGLSLFFSLSIPAYFQQYESSPESNFSVPSYFQPYIVTSHGPFRSKYEELNYVLNMIFSLHMVIAFLVALILDNTVPGSKQERELYGWSKPNDAREDPFIVSEYGFPARVGRCFRWVKWVGF